MLKQYSAQIDLELAKANSALRVAEQHSQIVYSTLHVKRAELISDVYKRLTLIVRLLGALQRSAASGAKRKRVSGY
ncbi:hypothetical protein FAZ69_27575 [Trinickia terrae]|uniref:Uncharacterized protein n=1 Tax=Trinickia terrae TaxID=2571161 RepID=A0A4U1HPJ0_9BURK|nr:hypothetical protein [Trinickia terrae]TKC81727.1 hypothetical protein FAZ69_27575 [Trinickia terrae]